MKTEISIGSRKIGPNHPVLVIPDIGINHEGDFNKAKQMIKDAAQAGAECAKFQMHVIEDEMIPEAKKVIPGNADVSIWEIMERCALTKEQHIELKELCESLGLIYLCTPFSREAADHLHEMNVEAYKIGSGECNNYPLIEHIASFGKPIIISTGMNDFKSLDPSINILEKSGVEYALMHCTSMYPTPYNKVRLGAIEELKHRYNAPVGLSDHSFGNYTCYGAVALGACMVEKHYTSDKSWPGPDIEISMDQQELKKMIIGVNAIKNAMGGKKGILPEEQVTIDFAYASVVTIAPVKKGDTFTKENIWVKRPGTGELLAKDFKNILGYKATQDIEKDVFLKIEDIEGYISDK